MPFYAIEAVAYDQSGRRLNGNTHNIEASSQQDAIEIASDELNRGSERLLKSEVGASDIQEARVMVKEAIQLTQTAINRLGTSLELPETIQLANQTQVRDYAIQIMQTYIIS